MMTLRGSCLCGAVRFVVEGLPSAPVACHCVQCRKGSGHYTASAAAPRAAVAISGAPRWYDINPTSRRGFCPECGTPLFWETARDPAMLSFELGAVDGPTGLRLAAHMFTDEKADYYEICDGLPAARGEREE